MAKAIDKDYLLTQLRLFEGDVLAEKSIATEGGYHGFRYYNNKFAHKVGNTWYDIDEVLDTVGYKRTNLFSGDFNNETISGITLQGVVDLEKDYTVYEAAGLNTSFAEREFFSTKEVQLKKGTYKLTGCPANGGPLTYCLRLYDMGGLYIVDPTVIATDIGNGATFTINNSYTNVKLSILIYELPSPTTVLTFKPMITRPDYNGEYVGGKETVLDKLNAKLSKVTPATSGNFASLNSNGTLKDSGKNANSFLTNTYLDQTVTTVANTETTVTFTNGLITSDKVIDVFAGRSTGDVSGAQNVFPYKDIYVDNTNHTCTITYPALDSAISLKVRIYIH